MYILLLLLFLVFCEKCQLDILCLSAGAFKKPRLDYSEFSLHGLRRIQFGINFLALNLFSFGLKKGYLETKGSVSLVNDFANRTGQLKRYKQNMLSMPDF